ncbi:hypothetical protein SDC9_168272 [bioreactor metagenome]|uniref:Beta-galactosidase trimerisation domain-containing protein n=1 Tax=bioreactor metagenome TaxID=1076179 RepID=A0A645GAI0_9ZZZZ
MFDPGTVDMTAETADALRRFVLDGGTLVCNRYTAIRGKGKGLVEALLGTPPIQVGTTGETVISAGGIPIRNRELAGFRLTPETSVLNVGETAVAFVARAGKGRVAFNGVPYSHGPELEPELLAAAGEPRAPWHSSLRAECRMLKNDAGDILLVVSNREDEPLNGFLNLPESLNGGVCTDRVSGETIPVSDSRIPCEIGAGMFRIFLFPAR